jgi:radical SAM PhpK family P-methyltransferase
MSKEIDCFLIGHNEMNFQEFEKTVRKMGVKSGAYRDLNLNFINYNKRPYSISDFYNLLVSQDESLNNPGRYLYLGETFSAAIAYLGTYIQRKGFTFDYINSFRDQREELAEKLIGQNIHTIALITTLYVMALPIIEIIRFVKKYNTSARIIVGGPFISTQCRTLAPGELEYLFESIDADVYVNCSQGESTLVKILHAIKNNLSLEGINNIYYKTAAGFAAAAPLPENNRLSENPVNWGLFSDRVGQYVNARTAISCPFSCAFCGFPEHAGKYQTTTVEEIEKELNQLEKIKTLGSIHFIDDTFNVPVHRFKEILRMMVKNKYNFLWHSHFRCQFADREMVELMKQSGCEGVFLGLESGSQQILKSMQKNASIERYYKGIALLKEYDITTFASFIIGFPGETMDTVKETRKLIETGGVDFYRAQLWYCETVTPIWRQRHKYNLEGRNFEWSHCTMNSGTAADLIDEMFLTVDSTTWVPQYNFDFDNIFHLTHRGMTILRIKDLLTGFNRAVREKLMQGQHTEVSAKALTQMLNACLTNEDGKHLLEKTVKTAEARKEKWNNLASQVEFDF